MNIQEKRKYLFKLVKLAEIKLRLYQEKYEEKDKGLSLINKAKKLLKYKGRYLKFVFSKIVGSLKVNSNLFFGRNFALYLPSAFGVYFFGILDKHEIGLTKFLIKNLDENSIFYDVGAHYGFYSVLAKEIISQRGEVHAFEPIPKSFKILKENFLSEENIFLNKKALFSREGEKDIYEARNIISESSTFSIESVKGPFSDQYKERDFKKTKVDLITLDKYCFSHKKPTFLKIDAESSEPYIIEGGMNTLKISNPVISMEVWSNELCNWPHIKATEYLYRLGYKSYKIKNNGDLRYIEKINFDKDIDKQSKVDNFIFRRL